MKIKYLLQVITMSVMVTGSLNVKAQEADTRGYIVKVGQACPDFELTLQDGTTTSFKELKGKVVMLQFTASWCGVCRKEMPHIESEIWQVYKDKGLVLLGVDRGEPLEKVKTFAEKMEITYPLALDVDQSVFQSFALAKAGVTRNILIDRNGKIVYLTRLYNIEEFSALKDKIKELMTK